jgi:hypothetical protein
MNSEKVTILHLPFWNSFPWEVNSFPEPQNIKESEAVYCVRANPYFRALRGHRVKSFLDHYQVLFFFRSRNFFCIGIQ